MISTAPSGLQVVAPIKSAAPRGSAACSLTLEGRAEEIGSLWSPATPQEGPPMAARSLARQGTP